jgi:hypothetical protein
MRAQCVLVATTLLHSGAKFYSFLYTGSKTVHVNMESCYGGMSTRLKQSAVTEFFNVENVTPAEVRIKLVLSMKAKDNGPVSVKAVA